MKRRAKSIVFFLILTAVVASGLAGAFSFWRSVTLQFGDPAANSLKSQPGWRRDYYSIGISHGWMFWQWDHEEFRGTLVPHTQSPRLRKSSFEYRWYLFKPSVPFPNDPNRRNWFFFDFSNMEDDRRLTAAALDLFRVRIPLWAIELPLIGLASWLWYWRSLGKRREQRMRECRCIACGYDLRASPDRCPECGTIPAVKGAAT